MHHHYSDIRSLISEQPRWFDEHAVPRYCDFSPDEIADIYADECALQFGLGLSEPESHRALQRFACGGQVRLADAAEIVVRLEKAVSRSRT